MEVRVNGGAGFSTDVNFNPRGLYENSGVRQWEGETLIAIQRLQAARRAGCCVVELPAHATTPQEVKANSRRIRFDTEEQAEGWIGRNYPASVVLVQHEDIVEEIERRRALAVGPECA
jgi:hypothetical protein